MYITSSKVSYYFTVWNVVVTGTEKMRFLGYHKGHRGYRLMERGSNRVFYRTDEADPCV